MGTGTVYGDFKEIREMARITGNIADKAVISELSMELSTPPSTGDEQEGETSEGSEQTTQTSSETTSEKSKNAETSSETTSPKQSADDDLF